MVLIISSGNLEDHLNKVNIGLKKQKTTGFKINIKNLFSPVIS